ncbi:MAG: metal-dependent hydrolase [Mojavia pulchra JT2-VF2]|jgi:predicted metal-dependent hydrolase|uniref:Metal-dependent hydrolase n=1 Tax=Mojavia pulchra JT2-VF2 TaxID=287848 RepID=A0A951PVR0_9NOST|nr:metal-dependent hydrolase [Mojavia pulchra JT2-VF2]
MDNIKVRQLNLDFSQSFERYWFKQSIFKTHLFNSFTLGVPDIEKYLIRNAKKRIKFIGNPQLKQQAQAFILQEGQHSVQHIKFWHNLKSLGYKFDTYLNWLQMIFFNILERRMSTNLNLAISVGIEHLTTLMAEFVLEVDLFAEAEPQLKQLFEWHAVEELEHKTVLFDVLQDKTSNYLLRLVGMFIAHILILFFLNLGLAILLYQDKKLLDRKVWQELIEFWITKDKFLYKVLFNAIDALKKDFHPSQKEHLWLIQKVAV